MSSHLRRTAAGRYVVEADYSTDNARQVLVLAEPQTVIAAKREESITLIVNRSIK